MCATMSRDRRICLLQIFITDSLLVGILKVARLYKCPLKVNGVAKWILKIARLLIACPYPKS